MALFTECSEDGLEINNQVATQTTTATAWAATIKLSQPTTTLFAPSRPVYDVVDTHDLWMDGWSL